MADPRRHLPCDSISYEDAQSAAVQANCVLSNQLGGAIIWHLNADDGQYTLTNVLVGTFQSGTGNARVV
jgi:GH18 family chitinase